MITNKVLAGIIATSVLATWLGVASADFWGNSFFGKAPRVELSDEQKELLQDMTQEERQEYFQEQREERQEAREARETVIDKLLAGQTLTDAEEEIRQEIIEHRAEMKAQIQEREEKMEAVKAVLEKKRNGEEITDEEQALLDEAKSHMKNKKGNRGMHR